MQIICSKRDSIQIHPSNRILHHTILIYPQVKYYFTLKKKENFPFFYFFSEEKIDPKKFVFCIAAMGRSACHSPGVYPSSAGFLPSYHSHQHHNSHYHQQRGSSPHLPHSSHGMQSTMGPPHHHQHHQSQSLQHIHYRQSTTCKYFSLFFNIFPHLSNFNLSKCL